MEAVKHHVTASGNSTLRGFFSSDNVDFDPPSRSLRHNITKSKARAVYGLKEGWTSDADEREIRDIMKNSEDSSELFRLLGVMEGWEGIDDELEYGQVDEVATQLAQVFDQRDYVAYQLVRRYLILLDYNNSPNLGHVFDRLLHWPNKFQKAEFDSILSQKAALLKGIASATMRGRTAMEDAARIIPDVINSYAVTNPHRSAETISLMHEVNYTTTICASLRKLEYGLLYPVIADMVDPAIPGTPSGPGQNDLRRIACRDTCQRLRLEFAAAAKAVEAIGDDDAKASINNFMALLKTTLDNFPATLPAPSAVGAIVAALGKVGNTIADLRKAIIDLPGKLTAALTLPSFLGSDSDDKARNLINELKSDAKGSDPGSLARLAWEIKLKLVNWLLSSGGLLDVTGDDEEEAIDAVMRAARDYDRAELFQLVASATWDGLDSNIQGEEFDELMDILSLPLPPSSWPEPA
jgi:hypothetical protein